MRLIADVAAGLVMARGEVDLVVVGADRIAANGDTANKIGTYARGGAGAPPRHPVLRRRAVLDHRLRDRRPEPPSRSRSGTPREVRELAGPAHRAGGLPGANPAFDVTPAALITAIITERGIYRGPTTSSG